MVRFAHLSDVHLGAFRDDELRQLNLQAFLKTIDECVALNVDFIVIAGDLFDVSLPDLGVVEKAVRKMREAKDKGIVFYVVYGSHDYSPTETSVIDVLEGSGLVKKVSLGRYEDGKLKLDFVTDKKTGVKLCGLNARKKSLEKTFFNDLDIGALEKEPGQKIFVFHSALAEFKPSELWAMDAIPASQLPKMFSYYAAGHVHSRKAEVLPGFGWMVFPGPLFAADFRDLEQMVSEKHGFYMVELKGDDVKPAFHAVDLCSVFKVELNAAGKTSEAAARDLLDACEKDVRGRIVLLKVFGVLSQGSVADVPVSKARSALLEKGAVAVYVNRHQLASAEREEARLAGLPKPELEETLLNDSVEKFNGSKELKGAPGLAKAKALLEGLKQENAGMPKKDFEELVAKRAKQVLA